MRAQWFTCPFEKIERVSGLLFLWFLGALVVSCPSVQDTAVKHGDSDAFRDDEDDGVVELSPAEALVAPGELESRADEGGIDASQERLQEEIRLGRIVPLEREPLSPFFDSLKELEAGKRKIVRILHYGDSHTAADFLTTSIRRALQSRFGDGGRGFALLGKPWRSYLPKDISMTSGGQWEVERIRVAGDRTKMDGYYGLSGISVTSDSQTSWTRLATVRGRGWGNSASVLEVFYLYQPDGGAFTVRVDGALKGTVQTASKRKRSGFFKVKVPQGAHQFEIRPTGNGPVRFFGAVVENDGPGVVYDTLGVNGGFFYTPLRWNQTALTKQIERRDPQLIVTMYGTNEADSRTINPSSYKAQVSDAMAGFRRGAPQASCLIVGPPDRRIRPERSQQLDWIIEVQREVAQEIGCAFIDLREIMGGTGYHEVWQRANPPLAQSDGIHLTVKGYRILGERVAAEILAAYNGYRK